MNSRSSVNESNLVNYSTDLSTLNQLDTKEPLLSFPFDHIYACHSESADRSQTLTLDKEVEISTHCVVSDDKEFTSVPSTEVTHLSDRLTEAVSQNKKLKELLLFHLDLIQQQNDLITKRDKQFQALRLENDTLRSKLSRMDKKGSANQRPNLNLPPPPAIVPSPPVTSTVVKNEPNKVMFNSLTELLLPDTRTNPYYFNTDLNKSQNLTQESFQLPKVTETDVSSYLTGDLSVPSMSILDPGLGLGDNFNMIDNKTFVKQEAKPKPELKPEPLYTVTSNSGNPIIQKLPRSRRRTGSGIGSLSRMPKTTPKTEKPETSKPAEKPKKYERTNNSVHKKSKMISTYGKTKGLNAFKKTTQVTGSLSERLKLIDTTPTGEDPYQLGEADLREQSPIPKLMLQKSNRRRRFTDPNARRIYDPAIPETITKIETEVKPTDTFSATNISYNDPNLDPAKTVIVQEPDLDLVKTEPEIDWGSYSPPKPGTETSLCDFSYGENPNNLHIPSLDSIEFQDLFAPDASLNLDNLTAADFGITEKPVVETQKPKKRGRTATVITPDFPEGTIPPMTPVAPALISAPTAPVEMPTTTKRGTESKRGRKRAFSATGVTKGAKREATPKTSVPKPKVARGKTAARGKKSPVPGKTTTNEYPTLVGDPDVSWYLGLDPDVKPEDVDEPDTNKAATVEVPRWREKPYTSCYSLEGTENLDDKVFEKRHQKLEAEERRQLRWHMRRIREQRHVERLRQRQRDWCGNTSFPQQPAVYTIWPQPQRDARFIEITDRLPVMAFGEILPDLPESDFKLPWIRSSRCLKRSKRSKTLH